MFRLLTLPLRLALAPVTVPIRVVRWLEEPIPDDAAWPVFFEYGEAPS